MEQRPGVEVEEGSLAWVELWAIAQCINCDEELPQAELDPCSVCGESVCGDCQTVIGGEVLCPFCAEEE